MKSNNFDVIQTVFFVFTCKFGCINKTNCGPLKLTTHKLLCRILKDNILNRLKCYNVPDLVSFLLAEDSNYYKTKLIDIGNNRLNTNYIYFLQIISSTIHDLD